jgi:hypothetical protein
MVWHRTRMWFVGRQCRIVLCLLGLSCSIAVWVVSYSMYSRPISMPMSSFDDLCIYRALLLDSSFRYSPHGVSYTLGLGRGRQAIVHLAGQRVIISFVTPASASITIGRVTKDLMVVQLVRDAFTGSVNNSMTTTAAIYGIGIPCWAPTTLIAFACLVSVARRGARAIRGRCAHCGYILHGLTEPRCPECGTPFEMSKLKEAASSQQDATP